MFWVYMFKNKMNGKIYVGKTNNLEQRFHDHSKMDGQCPAFHNALKKYGIDSFDFIVLGEFEQEIEGFKAEIYYIDYFKSNIKKYGDEFGYNMTDGGDGPSGYKHTGESKKKMSDKLKGRISPRKGKKLSDEQKLRLSISHMGQEGFWKNKKLSDKHKLNLSEAHKGYVMPEAQKLKISQSNMGKKGVGIKGEDNILSKISIIEANEMRTLYATNRYAYIDLAKMFNIKSTTVYRVIKNISYVDNTYVSPSLLQLHKHTGLLIPSQVVEIKKRIANGEKNKNIAIIYGVDCSSISNIRRGKNWKHIKG